ncbi:hypothetical protein FACS1894102_1760 [Spirochaetia bacterium]|nr:hypothetical protein FACS1894102_1760 [Spirochaetia bacterium]
MLYCHQCKVTVKSNFRRCPLCSSELIENNKDGTFDGGDDVFPAIPLTLKPFKRYINFVGFGTIVVAAISVAVDIAVHSVNDLGWSVFVIAGIASLWLSFGIANKQWWNIPKNIFWQLVLLSVLEILWDWFTGFHKWSFNYVIPIMFSCSIVALSVFAHIKKLRPGDYILILFIITIVSICSLLLIIFHLVTVVYPALVCFTFSIISSARIILFEGKSLLAELDRRMHM